MLSLIYLMMTTNPIAHTKTIKLLPYSISVIVVMCTDIDAARLQLKLKPYSKKSWDKGTVGYSYIDTSKNEQGLNRFQPYLFINVPKIIDWPDFCDTVSHEAVHTVDKLFEFSGIDTDYNNNEPYAYLLGYLVGEVVRFYQEVETPEFCFKNILNAKRNI